MEPDSRLLNVGVTQSHRFFSCTKLCGIPVSLNLLLGSNHSEPLSVVTCQCQPIREGHSCISHLCCRQMAVGTSSITAFRTVGHDPIWNHITQCSGHRKLATTKFLNLQPTTKNSENQTCNEPKVFLAVLSSVVWFNFMVALVLSTQGTYIALAVTPQC